MSLSPPGDGVKAANKSAAPGLSGHVPPAGAMLAAISGGSDSVALLRLLVLHAREQGWQLSVAHVDHGLRPDSARDAEFVRELAAGLGLPFLMRRVQASQAGRSPEEAARLARRAALAEMARESGAGVIALAHTADDQAETVMARMLVGTGPSGLAGMRPWDEPFWRPLLHVRRQALRQWLVSVNQAWRDDPSNDSLDPLRNRIRHKLMPLAAKLVNPRSVEALARLAALSADEEDDWQQWCAAALEQLAWPEGDSLVFDAPALAGLSMARQRRLLRFAAQRLTGSGQHLLALHVAQLIDLLHGRHGRSLTLPCGLMAWREDNQLRLGRSLEPPTLNLALNGPASVALPHLGKMLKVELCQEADNRSARGPVAWLPADRVRWPLLLRHPNTGERFHPLGAPGSKRISRILMDRKVPAWWRTRSLVVADSQGPWWLGPWAVAERARLATNEKAYVRLSFVDTPRKAQYTNIFKDY